MKYVAVNRGLPKGDYVLVDNEATGEGIKLAAIRQSVVSGYSGDWQLLGHNANGSASVIGGADIPWQHDFSMNPIYDNA